ncbi:MAG: response regulator [Halieaceae bacterium]|nr:response regulator [Halieaceae bacterium]
MILLKTKPMPRLNPVACLVLWVMGYGTIILSFSFLVALLLIALYVDQKSKQSGAWFHHTLDVKAKLTETLSILQDMETGQRGYIITGKEEYLEPFNLARPRVDQFVAELKFLTQDNPSQQAKLKALAPLIDAKVKELENTVLLRSKDGFKAALSVVETNKGKQVMDEIRFMIQKMGEEEARLLVSREQAFNNDRDISRIGFLSFILLFVGLSIVIFYRLRLAHRVTEDVKMYSDLFKIWKDSDIIGILRSSATGDVIDANETFLTMLGYTTEDFHEGNMDWRKLTPPEFLHLDANAIEQATDNGSWSAFEKEYFHKDGTRVPIIIGGTKYRDDPAEYIVFVIDLSAQKQLESHLRRAQKMEAIGQLTGGIAHDFNNILGIIMGNLDLLKDQLVGDTTVLKRVATIDRSVQRAVDLTKQLLEFSRHQATDVVMSDINQVVLDMSDMIKRSITPAVEVNQDLAEGLWLTDINLGDFQDALVNLVLNARDAMPDGGRLTIETRNCHLDATYCFHHFGATPGEYVQLIVSDTGVGISSEQQVKIFDPFYTTKDPGKGTGLGLAMAFGFVTRSNGYIDVESELGVGTTFHLYFARTAAQVPVNSIVDRQPEANSRGSGTILAVDDEEELAALAKESLEAVGYRVLTATNGKEALERLAEHPDISLLFSDVVMPGGINGYELAEQAMGIRSDLKILLTSGHTEKVSGRAQQAYNPMMKPYSFTDLIRRVQSLLDESKNASR